MSSSFARIAPLEYPLAECAAPAVLTLLAAEDSQPPMEPEPQMTGMAEEEVEQRVQAVRDAAFRDADDRVRQQMELVRQDAQQKMSKALSAFEQERQAYFKRVEHEIVKLSLAVARKILEREAEIDPSLLPVLVRRALNRMQCGSSVRVRVAPGDLENWREQEAKSTDGGQWEIVADSALNPGDCIVETSVGSANFGLDAQLNDVEQSFLQLLVQSPAA